MNDPGDEVVSVSDLRKTYRDGLIRRTSIDALRGVAFSVKPGEIFGLIGPNGAGKTTLIKILLGIVHKSGGEARLLGHQAGDRRSRERVGYLPEGHRIPRHLTGNTALEYYGQLSNIPMSRIRERRPVLLKRMGLTQSANRSVKGYSKGMLQRLGLAQALLHDPDLVFLDEPTDGVDPRGRAQIRDLLVELKSQGKSIFVNSHQLQELELVCDRVAMMEKGQIRFLGTVDESTQRQGPTGEVQLVIQGTAEQLQQALDGRFTARVRPLTEDRLIAEIPVNDQSEIDAIVDAIRLARLSLCELKRQRRSLEEAFLELIPEVEDGG